MELQALKKSDGKIWLVNGDISRVMETGDSVIELPENWQQPNMKFRDYWRESAGNIVVDMLLARTQKMVEIRAERDKRLLETDAEWVELSSKGLSLTALNTKKQTLRDITISAQTAVNAETNANILETYQPIWP